MAMEFAARPKMGCNNAQAQDVFIWVLALPAYEDSQLAGMFMVSAASHLFLSHACSSSLLQSHCWAAKHLQHNAVVSFVGTVLALRDMLGLWLA